MALAECNTTVDPSGRELIEHGTIAFPAACYQDDFSQMDVPWHWHDELEAAVLIRGSCVVAAGNEKFTLRAGEGFFINSGILHGCWDTEGSGCMFHSIVFHPRLVGGSPDSVFQRDYLQPLLDHPTLEIIPLSPECSWQSSALDAIEQAWQACTNESKGFEFQARSALSELIFQIHCNLPAFTSKGGERALRDSQRIKAMLSYIHTHFGEELTTRDIAGSITISESECLRCFRGTIGTTPIQYLKQHRIRQASKQLIESHDQIADIALRCGFQDMSYFSKTFRELLGCTPSQYRKNASH